ncbi:MAG: transporter substrate-binding domain-containing protein [Bacteroidota bacterium]
MNFKEKILFAIFITLIIALLLTFNNHPGWTVAVVRGTRAENQIRRFRNVRNRSEYRDHFKALADLEDQKVDVVIMDYLSILNLKHQSEEIGFKLAGERLTHTKGRVAFRLEDNSLRQKFNQALSELIEDGTYQRLSLKYFGIDQDLSRTVKTTGVTSNDQSWDKVRSKGVIKFGMIFNNPPFCYYDQQNRLAGFEVELAKTVSKRLGIKCLLLDVQWNGAVERLIAQSYDAFWAGANNFRPFRKKIKLSEAYYDSGAQLVVKPDSPITGLGNFERSISAFDLLFRRRSF